VDLKALAELRKRTGVSISKAREALVASSNDLDAASAWLDKDLAGSGAKKLEKLQGRTTNEGVIALSVISPGLDQSLGGRTRAAMVELNCETDFVGRNDLLRKLAADIAHTAAYLAEPAADPTQPFYHYAVNDFGEAPLLAEDPREPSQTSESINVHIRNAVAKMGEKITLRRAVALAREPSASHSGFRVTSYIHGALANDPKVGRVGTLVDLSLISPTLASLASKPEFGKSLATLERALARQVVGLNAARIRRLESASNEDPEALYDQEFMMHPAMAEKSVETALRTWSQERGLEEVRVNDFVRWKVGEAEA